jgi:putative ABC transport system permease protein
MKTFLKSIWRDVLRTKGRFLSILVIAAVGVGFFTGIRVSAPDMRHSADMYYDRQRLADFRLVSTYGFDDNDMAALGVLPGVQVVPGYQADLLTGAEGSSEAAHIISLNTGIASDAADARLNLPVLREGSLPQADNECAVLEGLLGTAPKVGTSIELFGSNEDFPLTAKSFIVTGIYTSPSYIDMSDFGNTQIGAGTVDLIMLVPETAFKNRDYYTEVYLCYDDLAAEQSYQSGYTDLAAQKQDELEALAELRQTARFNEIKDEANRELSDAQGELDSQRAEAEQKLNDAQDELDTQKADAEQKLNDAQGALDAQKAEAEQQFAAAQGALDAQKADAEEQLAAAQGALDAQKAEAEQQLAAAQDELDTQKADAEQKLNDAQGALDAQRAEAEQQFAAAQGALDAQKAEAEQQLAAAQGELDSQKAEAEQKISDAQAEIDDQRRQVDDLAAPEWYIFDRDDNPGYSEYAENAQRITNISYVFPVFFLLVACLVCYTCIQRMITEQRGVVGTLLSLGYGGRYVVFKYMLYALSAALIGSAAGCLVGMQLFPQVIINAYKILYSIPDVNTAYDGELMFIVLIGTAIAIAVTVITAVYGEVTVHVSELLRPKSPPSGKRVLLERIALIWNRLSFSLKVSVRNVFRYKKRLMMTLLGVSGCTALLLTGFGLKDSIGDIVHLQFDELQQYTGMVALDADSFDAEAFEQSAEELNQAVTYVYLKQVTLTAKNGKTVTANVAAIDTLHGTEFFMNFRERVGKKPLNISDGAIVTEKAALKLNLKAGDEVLANGEHVLIAGVCENYVGNYLFMDEGHYQDVFGAAPEYNMAYIKGAQNRDVAEALMDVDGVLAVNFVEDLADMFAEALSVLNYIIIVIIAAAALLAFIVLYTLTAVNVSEREREIATLKVLGYYDYQVDGFIFRENIFITLLGALIGLVLGVFLCEFVVSTVELDSVMFGRHIHALSFLWAGLLTGAFAAIVAVVMHFVLRRVDMAGSLNSIE